MIVDFVDVNLINNIRIANMMWMLAEKGFCDTVWSFGHC